MSAGAGLLSSCSAFCVVDLEKQRPDNFDYVECNKQKLTATLSSDKKSIIVKLPSSLVVPPAVVLEFVFKKASSLTYSIEVFDTKVDLPAQQAQPAPSTQPAQPK
jgi:hypothetical protein